MRRQAVRGTERFGGAPRVPAPRGAPMTPSSARCAEVRAGWRRGAESTRGLPVTDAAQASDIEAPPTNALVAHRHGRADAVPPAGGARSDDRGDGAADDRRRSRWARPDLVGRHGLPAVVDRQRAAVRQDQRPLRPQGDAPDHHRHLPARLGAGRPRPVDAAADPRPRRAGRRRRRDHGDDVHDPRRHPLAA